MPNGKIIYEILFNKTTDRTSFKNNNNLLTTNSTGSTPYFIVSKLTSTMVNRNINYRRFTVDVSFIDVNEAIDSGKEYGFSTYTWSINNIDTSRIKIIALDNIPLQSNAFQDFRGTFDDNFNITNEHISHLESLEKMFENAVNFNKSVNSLDVSKVTNMSNMFNGATSFNQPLNKWDVSKVTNMSGMFQGVTSFNQYISTWDVSKVTNMSNMFNGATSFNQELHNENPAFLSTVTQYATNLLLNKWDVSNVTNMSGMFQGATSFNQPLNHWNVGEVRNMSGMFQNAILFDQYISSWDVSKVINMTNMFNGATSFNQPLNNDNPSFLNVISSYDKDIPIDRWVVTNVEEMSGMFHNASSFNQPLYHWDIKTNNLSNFLKGATSFSTDNYSNLLISIVNQLDSGKLEKNGILDASSYYNSSVKSIRNDGIISNYEWTVNDIGP